MMNMSLQQEFAARHLKGGSGVSGMWGVPSRNSLFTGREPYLAAIRDHFSLANPNSNSNSSSHSLATPAGKPARGLDRKEEAFEDTTPSNAAAGGDCAAEAPDGAVLTQGIKIVEVVGLGGVGKTQVLFSFTQKCCV
jgi:hypothetical protein